MQKKRRVSIWMIPIIAFIGLIGFFAHVDGEPKRRIVNKHHVKTSKKVPEYDFGFVQTQLIADVKELQIPVN